MTTFRLIVSTPSTLLLGDLLLRHGATQASEADLLIVAASSLAQAREQLGKLAHAERTRCLIVGLTETLDVRTFPSPDNIAGLLEEFLPLGVLTFEEELTSASVFDFIGRRSLADAMGTPYLKANASEHYAGYMEVGEDDAGAFVLRYLRAR